MFDLASWYENLPDKEFQIYEGIKQEVKAALTGTGERADTTFGKLAGLYKDLFGQTLDQVNGRAFYMVRGVRSLMIYI